ncbi:hypothetical protein EV2_027592 [Malus domestica]
MPQQNSHSSFNQTVQEHGNYSQVVQNNPKKVSQIIQQRYHRRLHQHYEESSRYEELEDITSSSSSFEKRIFTKENIAAIRLQAFFRGHLARQAFRALRSLVKLQALVRGVCARKQARIALHCMDSIVRLQVKVRARQLLSVSSDGRSIAS